MLGLARVAVCVGLLTPVAYWALSGVPRARANQIVALAVVVADGDDTLAVVFVALIFRVIASFPQVAGVNEICHFVTPFSWYT